MKKIETTNIAALAKAPFLKATHDQYTETIQETTAAIVTGLIGSYTTGDVIILHGCVVVANIPGTSTVTAGAIYYNGEIYQVDANASILSPANTLVWNTATTYRSGDPVQWSDLTTRNLHAEVKFVLSNAVSGSGIANYNGATVKKINDIASSFTIQSSSNLTSPVVVVGRARRNGREVTYSLVVTGTTIAGATNYNWVINAPSGFKMTESLQAGGTNLCTGILSRSVAGVETLSIADSGTDLNSYIDASNRLIIGDASHAVGATTAVSFTISITGDAL